MAIVRLAQAVAIVAIVAVAVDEGDSLTDKVTRLLTTLIGLYNNGVGFSKGILRLSDCAVVTSMLFVRFLVSEPSSINV